MTSTLLNSTFITLRFSGCGHLLPYHLGVSTVLLEEESRRRPSNKPNRLIGPGVDTKIPKVKAVAGSSAGAIAAAMYSRLPHRLEEYASTFISERGHALEILKTMLHEEENGSTTSSETLVTREKNSLPPSLHISATKCADGSHHLFNFSPNLYPNISSCWATDDILEAVKASCSIPQSFHPADIVFKNQSLSYPNSEGVLIDDDYFVDGGIAAPAPSTPRDNQDGAHPIIISPISAGSRSLFFGEDDAPRRISPLDNSWRLLPISTLVCRGNFRVKPSIQNLKAMRVASGMAASVELQEWYDLGVSDALRKLDEWSASSE
uniref:PNPLA domain-containing protein n=1 Tax=Chaetoceros debilis TaxID=122233 RepID=A0A7S3VGY4_9STRA|mmetsp:Transcript_28436/g.43546  ORF Transcript_28436/g.43546 Transcript_28436/m.43546 type:complete len:321 (+) Transcript_28436:85-1047(+)|eukprot:CAMPEP_0194123884 /NCGR_PEP_ID=MMETSP0150-20130528/56375_1 /TAXON_ID=122233 /ORGANISM="Chaetoceros debilis, Strain MM31A-1" /LENGTH=320 /DNA_ID=CAMNT_0038817345 /DNA_START=79 /DNA_END=1041 /DNA_ORIENTATION=-